MLYKKYHASPHLQQQNKKLLADFLIHIDHPDIKKTHYFGNRYENIYMNSTHVPALADVILAATNYANKILNESRLRAGYWFNFMPPGSVTTSHRHDDDDELLSAVYYLSVPENSGNLLLQEKIGAGKFKTVKITPEAGMFVFFKPDVVHEVTENKSDENRLSIGMNFGVPGESLFD